MQFVPNSTELDRAGGEIDGERRSIGTGQKHSRRKRRDPENRGTRSSDFRISIDPRVTGSRSRRNLSWSTRSVSLSRSEGVAKLAIPRRRESPLTVNAASVKWPDGNLTNESGCGEDKRVPRSWIMMKGFVPASDLKCRTTGTVRVQGYERDAVDREPASLLRCLQLTCTGTLS